MTEESGLGEPLTWHPRLETLRAELVTRRGILRAAIDGTPPAWREMKPADDRWSVTDVIEHLSHTKSGIAALIRRSVSSIRARTDQAEEAVAPELAMDHERLVDRSRRLAAPEAVRPRQGMSFDDAWRSLEAADDKLHSAMVSGNGLPLETVLHPHPALGPINLYQWMEFVGIHELRHADQIREIAVALAARLPPV